MKSLRILDPANEIAQDRVANETTQNLVNAMTSGPANEIAQDRLQMKSLRILGPANEIAQNPANVISQGVANGGFPALAQLLQVAIST